MCLSKGIPLSIKKFFLERICRWGYRDRTYRSGSVSNKLIIPIMKIHYQKVGYWEGHEMFVKFFILIEMYFDVFHKWPVLFDEYVLQKFAVLIKGFHVKSDESFVVSISYKYSAIKKLNPHGKYCLAFDCLFYLSVISVYQGIIFDSLQFHVTWYLSDVKKKIIRKIAKIGPIKIFSLLFEKLIFRKHTETF